MIDTMRATSIDLTPQEVYPLKIFLVTAFILCVIFLLPKKKIQSTHKAQPNIILRQASKFIIFSNIAIAAAYILPIRFSENNGGPADNLAILSGYIFGALAVFVVVRQIQWLDAVIFLRRTKNTNKYRILVFIGIILSAIASYIVTVQGGDSQEILGVIMGLALLIFFLLIAKIPWTISLSKSDKWRILFISLLILGLDCTIAGTIIDQQFYYHALQIFLPGIEQLIKMTFLFTGVFFFRIFISVLVSLPTAGALDRKMNEVRSLSYLNRVITQVYNPQQLLEIVTKMVSEVCGATGSWIELVSGDDMTSPTVAQFNIRHQHIAALCHSNALHSMLSAEKQPLFIESIREAPELNFLHPAVHSFANSLIAVPLTIDEKPIGTLFATHVEEFAFEREDLMILMAFADNISIAIENTRLFESSLEKEKYKNELMLARQMQQKLLPAVIPALAGFDIGAHSSPALEVGGDYYDFLRLKNGDFCTIIGDVSGKGISAAFYMAELKGVAMALAGESDSPKDLLQKINAAIFHSLDKKSYISMSAISIDTKKNTLIYARAGHTPLFVCRGNSVEMLTPRGIGVGLAKSTTFNSLLEEVAVPLSNCDCVLLFTDGVNEAMDSQNNEFGYDKIKNILLSNSSRNAEMLIGEVLRQIVDHAEGTMQHDDSTMISIIRKEKDNS